jgi:hypothetical protein
MRRLLPPLALVLPLLVAGCDGLRSASQLSLLVAPPLGGTYLRYEVESPKGAWSREFVVGKGTFAERRDVAGRAYALGLAGTQAWMRIGARAPVEIDGPLALDERTQAAWIGMRFGDVSDKERPELETCTQKECTLVYTPRDGHALWVTVDRGSHRPVSFQWIAQGHAIEACDGITWTGAEAVPAVASITCSAIVDKVGLETTSWTLVERRDDPVTPAWAQVEPDEVVPLHVPAEPTTVAIADPSTRVYVPVDAGGSALQLVLDTGSPMTVLSRRVLGATGVVRSPDPPVHVKPPWLPEDTYDPMIVDRLVIGGIELHGITVLVPRDDGAFASEEAGLLGMDLLSRYLVDVDGPASTLRIWPRALFTERRFVDLPYWGASHGAVVVSGSVAEIGRIPVILDTGAPLNVVVGGPAMHAKHPRSRGDGAMLSEGDGDSDYVTEVKGFHLGPFGLPRMPVLGHDRRPDLPFLDNDSALVGLGVLRHFRIVVDTQRSLVRVAPGPSYVVLRDLGIEIDDRAGAPTITRIVDAEHDWNKALREGDIVKSVGGKPVATRADALLALALSHGRVKLELERAGNRFERLVAMR